MSNFDKVNIILSIWELYHVLYMLLKVLSQNFIGMGWKMSELHIIIFTWVIFNCAGALCKKTYSFNKIYKKLIIKKSPNLAQNCVKSFLIKIFTKFQMWLVNLDSENNLNVFEACSHKNGFITASQRPKRLSSALPKIRHTWILPMLRYTYIDHSFFIPSQWNFGSRPLISYIRNG